LQGCVIFILLVMGANGMNSSWMTDAPPVQDTGWVSVVNDADGSPLSNYTAFTDWLLKNTGGLLQKFHLLASRSLVGRSGLKTLSGGEFGWNNTGVLRGTSAWPHHQPLSVFCSL
jgi:hypothetical protein